MPRRILGHTAWQGVAIPQHCVQLGVDGVQEPLVLNQSDVVRLLAT